MMPKKIAITTSTFAQFCPDPVRLLEQKGLSAIINKKGRTLKRDEVLELLEGCLGVVAGTEIYDREVLEKLQDLRLISRCGVGLDNVDLEICKSRGIKVFNTPDGPTLAVAELVVGLMLSLLRRISVMDQQIRAGIWKKKMGNLFSGKGIGIVGLGRIGRAVARLSVALGANILYTDPCVEEPQYKKLSLDALFKTADIITIHVPAVEENRNVITEKEFALMKKGAYLVNCSRGGIVDEKALYAALKDGQIAGAAVDVFEQEPYKGPLTELNNVILTPHIGSYAKEARVKMESEAVDNLVRGFVEMGIV